MSYYVSNTLFYPVFPWVYVDTTNVYCLAFYKATNTVQEALLATLDREAMFNSDEDAAAFLDIDNLKANFFTANQINDVGKRPFLGNQIGHANSETVWFLQSGAVFPFVANCGTYADGFKTPVPYRITTAYEGILSNPTKTIINKNHLDEWYKPNAFVSPFLDVIVNVNSASLDDCLVVLNYNPDYSYHLNKSANSTSNVANNVVAFLPSVSFTTPSSVNQNANLTVTVVQSNGAALSGAQSKVFLEANNGLMSTSEINANSSQVIQIGGGIRANGLVATFTASFEYYLNVSNASVNVISDPSPLPNTNGYYIVSVSNNVGEYSQIPSSNGIYVVKLSSNVLSWNTVPITVGSNAVVMVNGTDLNVFVYNLPADNTARQLWVQNGRLTHSPTFPDP